MPISSVLGSSALLPAGVGMRNKIINGDMRIAQRGATAVNNNAAANTYGGPDRWHIYGNDASKMSIAQSTTVPTAQGFTNSVVVTSLAATTTTSGYFGVRQYIEGYNTADLAWGTSGAKQLTISFWVRSSITGTYSLALHNSANTRCYPATYTIDSANTWEKKTLYVPGETSGVWVTDNGIGLAVWFDLGSHSSSTSGTANTWNTALYTRTSGTVNWIATNGATFYLTGVQLEQNYQATPFEQRPIGTELALCQRYYWRINAAELYTPYGCGNTFSTSAARAFVQHPVTMRSKPTSVDAANLGCNRLAISDQAATITITGDHNGTNGTTTDLSGSSYPASGTFIFLGSRSATAAYLGFSAEL